MAQEWYYTKEDGSQAGPIEREQLEAMFRSGELPPTVHIWNPALGQDWIAANKMASFMRIFASREEVEPPPEFAPPPGQFPLQPMQPVGYPASRPQGGAVEPGQYTAPPPAMQREFVLANLGNASADIEAGAGVKGWLLFLCISMTIIRPVLFALILFFQFGLAARYGNRFPSLWTMVFVEAFIYILIGAYSIVVGMALWKIWPGAVLHAKIFFFVYFLSQLAVSTLPVLFGLAGKDADGLALSRAMGTFMRAAIVCIAWVMYLSKSRRVKATYL